MKHLTSIAFCVCAFGLSAAGADLQRYFVHCSPKEDHAFKVTVDFDVKDLAKRSFTEYFKEEYSKEMIGEASGGLEIACGSGASLYIDESAESRDKGIEVSLEIKRTGKNPGSYEKKFLVPWTQLHFDASDTRAKITATVVWKARDESAAGR